MYVIVIYKDHKALILSTLMSIYYVKHKKIFLIWFANSRLLLIHGDQIIEGFTMVLL